MCKKNDNEDDIHYYLLQLQLMIIIKLMIDYMIITTMHIHYYYTKIMNEI